MQQTEKYKLNLIERDDPFLPDALNDSTRRIEAALSGLEAYADAGDAAVISRVVELEKSHFAFGCYYGTGEPGNLIHLGFAPQMVLLQQGANGTARFIFKDRPFYLNWVGFEEDGFEALGQNGANTKNYGYAFVAFGMDE